MRISIVGNLSVTCMFLIFNAAISCVSVVHIRVAVQLEGDRHYYLWIIIIDDWWMAVCDMGVACPWPGMHMIWRYTAQHTLIGYPFARYCRVWGKYLRVSLSMHFLSIGLFFSCITNALLFAIPSQHLIGTRAKLCKMGESSVSLQIRSPRYAYGGLRRVKVRGERRGNGVSWRGPNLVCRSFLRVRSMFSIHSSVTI